LLVDFATPLSMAGNLIVIEKYIFRIIPSYDS